MRVAEVIGYVAAVLVFMTFYMKTMIPLRIVGICSNCAFIMYGYLDGLYPVLILHLILLPLNSLRLREMLKLIKQVREATGGDPNMDWIKPFTSTRHVQPGEKVFHKGEPGRDMFVVMSGHFRLVETGIELKARDVAGEFALLTRKHSRTQTLECTEAGILLQITYGQVEQLFFQNARFGFYFLQLIAHRLLQNNERLEMELAHSRRAPVVYRPRWQRALSRTEKSATLGMRAGWCGTTTTQVVWRQSMSASSPEQLRGDLPCVSCAASQSQSFLQSELGRLFQLRQSKLTRFRRTTPLE